jgi:hypothetical protein
MGHRPVEASVSVLAIEQQSFESIGLREASAAKYYRFAEMRDSEDGSVLIEALAALAIISTVIIMALSGLSEAVRGLERAELQLSVLAEARSRLAEVSAADFLSSSVEEGVSATGLGWRITVKEDSSYVKQQQTARPFWVSIEVETRAAGASSVALDTVVIARPLRQ